MNYILRWLNISRYCWWSRIGFTCFVKKLVGFTRLDIFTLPIVFKLRKTPWRPTSRVLLGNQVSNEKGGATWLFRVYRGWTNTYVIWGLYLTSIRIPIRQPVEWKVRGFFVWLNLSLVFFAVNPSSSCCFPASSFLARELLGSCHHDAAKNKMNSGPKFPSFSEEWMPSCTSALGSSILSIWMKLDCAERRWVEVGWRGI